MKYPVEEERLINQKITEKIGMLYSNSDTIDKFKIDADLHNMPKSTIRLLVAYYHIRQHKTFAYIMTFAICLIAVLSTCIGIEVCCGNSNAHDYVGAIFAGFIVGSIIGSFVAWLAIQYFLYIIPRKFQIY